MSHPTISGWSHIANPGKIYYQTSPAELVEHALQQGEGILTETGALAVDTGKFTGRSPKDKYVVADAQTEQVVWWGPVNNRMLPDVFEGLYNKVTAYLEGKALYVRDAYAGADTTYRLPIRVIAEKPWQSLFAHNLFLRPAAADLPAFQPQFTVIAAPGFEAHPETDGTRAANFTAIDFTRRIILIGGSAYTGEIKKGIFTVLNYLLPLQGVLPMHCSANVGTNNEVALFFGLSGTGKTTLSTDPNRGLIGDDEHGWTARGVFNFEGGCYAKCINLSPEGEPQIYNAIRFGALLENTRFYPGTRQTNYTDDSVTENTRVAYPIHYIKGAVEPSLGTIPKHLFFLTADAFGVLPPISRLTVAQAMYQFMSGYTAKVAGTEAGVKEPQATFSACYGQVFLPHHPTKYAEMLGQKLRDHHATVWLINTGWTGGPYGTGKRMKLAYTRAMIQAALNGMLDGTAYGKDHVFGLQIPLSVPGVPEEVLHPRNTWADPMAYDAKANELAQLFIENFSRFEDFASDEIKAAGPKPLAVKV